MQSLLSPVSYTHLDVYKRQEPVVQCKGNKATKKLVSCLQPNRRVEIRAEGTKVSGCN